MANSYSLIDMTVSVFQFLSISSLQSMLSKLHFASSTSRDWIMRMRLCISTGLYTITLASAFASSSFAHHLNGERSYEKSPSAHNKLTLSHPSLLPSYLHQPNFGLGPFDDSVWENHAGQSRTLSSEDPISEIHQPGWTGSIVSRSPTTLECPSTLGSPTRLQRFGSAVRSRLGCGSE